MSPSLKEKVLTALLAHFEMAVIATIEKRKVALPESTPVPFLTDEERMELTRLELQDIANAFGVKEIDEQFARELLNINWPVEPLKMFSLLILVRLCMRELMIH